MSAWLQRGLSLVDAAMRGARAAGLPALRIAFVLRLGQALLLLAATWSIRPDGVDVVLLSGLGLAALLLEAVGPAAVLAAAEPQRTVHRWASVGAALIRRSFTALALAVPVALAFGAALLVGRPEDRVVVGLVAAPFFALGAGLALYFAARTGPAPLMAARGASPTTAFWSLRRRRVHLMPQVVVLALELGAAVVATTAMGWLEPAAVLERPWRELIVVELEVAALWRLLGAPIQLFAVFVHAAALQGAESDSPG